MDIADPFLAGSNTEEPLQWLTGKGDAPSLVGIDWIPLVTYWGGGGRQVPETTERATVNLSQFKLPQMT